MLMSLFEFDPLSCELHDTQIVTIKVCLGTTV
uniref:Uncharacterized protein n=1 Tax=Rhizophora mucronata TaxID=61149 RepID=A0A2P2PDK3_RHIMU